MPSIPILIRVVTGCGLVACAACAGTAARPDAEPPRASRIFYTVTAEIALSRHEVRVAALQYAAAAESGRDPRLLRRATEVTEQCLQPTLTAQLAARWIEVDPTAEDAHRAAAKAALDLQHIDQSAAQYRAVVQASPRGVEGELAQLETELGGAGNVYGARQVADRLVGYYPTSGAALRLQAFAALRADDPAAAVRDFEAALAVPPGPVEMPAQAAGDPATAAASPAAQRELAKHELIQGLWRARILAGDPDAPLAEAAALVQRDGTPENRLDYALLLLAARQPAAAHAELEQLAQNPDARPVALRLLGLTDFQQGDLNEAGTRFAELLTTGRFLDDGFYYLGLIAERHQDFERALRLYAQVQGGESAVDALLRAAAILRLHGAAPASDEVLDQLVDEEPQRAPRILMARARIDADAGDVPQGIAVLAQAGQEYPDNVELRYALASMSEDHGDTAAALKILRAVAASRPGDPAALNAYGYTLADHDRHLREARRLIERAYDAAPKNPAILDSLGWVLFRQGHPAQALPYLESAYADEHDGDIAAHLGEVLWRLDRRPDAERVWADAGRIDADSHLLKSTLERLHASK